MATKKIEFCGNFLMCLQNKNDAKDKVRCFSKNYQFHIDFHLI